MKFWDASAIVPLLIAEPSSRHLEGIIAKDSAMLVWWASEVECASALARLERNGAIRQHEITLALTQLAGLASSWNEVDPSDAVRAAAIRFLRVHALRAADALQLAAAFVGSEQRPGSLEIVTRDDRLASIARKEGFPVLQIIEPGESRF